MGDVCKLSAANVKVQAAQPSEHAAWGDVHDQGTAKHKYNRPSQPIKRSRAAYIS